MSYILEALKKSDKERQRDDIPDLQADHSLPPVRREERKPPVWRTPRAVIVGAACVGALLWWQFSADPPVPVDDIPTTNTSADPSREISSGEVSYIPEKAAEVLQPVKKQAVKSESQVVAPPTKPSTTPVAAVVKKRSVSPLTPAPAPVKKIVPPPQKTKVLPPPLLEDLPVAIRAGIPDLSFAGHVYSEVAEKRLIIINRRIVREGDLISNGLSLKQIDSDGVVLQYETSVFRVKLF